MPSRRTSVTQLTYLSQIEQRREVCKVEFGSRTNAVFDAGRYIFEDSPIGPLNSLELAMQIEREFPGQVETILNEAEQFVDDQPSLSKRLILVILVWRLRA